MSEFKLRDCLVFEGIDENYINEFITSCTMIDLRKGEFLFRHNDIGDEMYVIEKGEVQVFLENDDTGSNPQEKQLIGTLKKGALIGELCVFGQQKRSASVYADMNARLLKIDGEDFRIRIYSKDLDALLICYNIAKILGERIIATDTLLALHPAFQ